MLSSGIRITLAAVVVLWMVSMVAAQDVSEPLTLTNQIHILEYEAAPIAPPTIEMLSDGRVVFSVQASGSISGTVEGTITSRITEVHPVPPPVHQTFSQTFTIETEQGILEGYFVGSLYLPEGSDAATVNGHGFILSVSGAYADLFMADVFVTGQVNFVDGRSTGEVSTMTITPR